MRIDLKAIWDLVRTAFAPGQRLTKPPHGSPCNACGICCETMLCPMGRAVFQRREGPCPAMEQEDHKFLCGLAAHPARYVPEKTEKHGEQAMARAAARLIGSGHGCDFNFEGETVNGAFDSRMRKYASHGDHARARKIWNVNAKTVDVRR